jgi:hypothetical protein
MQIGGMAMSKYTEYREMAEKMETLYGAKIKDTDREASVRFNPVADMLDIDLAGFRCRHEFSLQGDEGKALYMALKQLYE